MAVLDTFFSCPQGLEKPLVQELQRVGLDAEEQTGGATATAEAINILESCLQTRTASRAHILLDETTIRREKDLYQKASEWPWEEWLTHRDTIKFNTLFDKDALHSFKNSHFFSLTAKDALADRLRKLTGKRPDVDTKKASHGFLLRVTKEEDVWKVTLWLDIIGRPLSDRGYRVKGHAAPIKENLAAGIALLAGLEAGKTLPVLDPFCGSGTLLLESALLMADAPPSYMRLGNFLKRDSIEWNFQKHRWFQSDHELVKEFKKMARKTYNRGDKNLKAFPSGYLYGRDNYGPSLGLCRDSAKRLKLDRKIELDKINALEGEKPCEEEGIILTNPPYGQRLEEKDLQELFHNFGEVLKNKFQGWRAFLLTASPDHRKAISLRTSKRIPLYNGPLECRLLQYDLF